MSAQSGRGAGEPATSPGFPLAPENGAGYSHAPMANDHDPEPEDFASLFAASERESSRGRELAVEVGSVVTGKVISIAGESVFVDLGGKSEGVLDITQVMDTRGQVTVAVGDRIRAHVVDAGEASGVVTLRCRLGQGVEARNELALAFEHRIPVEGLVQAAGSNGFDVQVAGLRAFCPVSQMDDRYVENPGEFVGKHLEFRVTRFEDHGRGEPNIVLSRRILLEEAREAASVETRRELAVGSVFRGVVRNIRDFGAFVDIGGIEGMLHISELGHFRVGHPSEVLAVDQEVEVQVIGLETTDDPRRPEKISLSLKTLMRDPWDSVPTDFPVGARVHGRVSRIETYGAFVELAPGIEGLVHVSEMGEGARVTNPRKLVEEGQEVEVSVLSIDLDKRRISLSMDAAGRAARAAEEKAAVEQFGPGRESLGTLGDLLAESLAKKK